MLQNIQRSGIHDKSQALTNALFYSLFNNRLTNKLKISMFIIMMRGSNIREITACAQKTTVKADVYRLIPSPTEMESLRPKTHFGDEISQ